MSNSEEELQEQPQEQAIEQIETKEESQSSEQSEQQEPQPRGDQPPRNPNREQNRDPNRAPNPNRDPNRDPNQRQNGAVFNDLKKCFDANERSHKERLYPHNRLAKNPNAKVRITPLGGLGEIGGNITVFETNNSAIIVDVGMSFPSEDMHGVDILVPDFSYLETIKNKIVAIIITHAHEDHIGAMAYLFKKMQFPIYATPLALGMIGNKFDEHKLSRYKSLFRGVEKRKIYKVGDFDIEWMHMTHSIVDSSSLAITTEAGTIIHTGDFKIDYTPIDGYAPDIHRLAAYGDKGVMLLMSDSTNSHHPGHTKSESSVGPTFDRLFKDNKENRVIMSTFSSNIHRVYQAMSYGITHGRKICIIGRSMEKNIENAMGLGYIKLPKEVFIEAHEINKFSDSEILIVTTGSQGEAMSALYRMATDEHRHVKLKPTDMIILSSKAIPGNEGSVSRVINFILKSGASVAYQDFSEIHVSGHAAQEEQKLMLRLVKPKYFLPVHGEYNHIKKHSETAIACGVAEQNILLMADGDQIEVNARYMKKVKTIKTGKTFIDNQVNTQIENDVVIDRQTLATEGIVTIIAQISQADRSLIAPPKVVTYGLLAIREQKHFAKEIEDILEHFVKNAKDTMMDNTRALENEMRQVVRKHIFRKLKKYPVIVPTIFVM